MKYLILLLLSLPLFSFSCSDQEDVAEPQATLQAETKRADILTTGQTMPLNLSVLVVNQFGQSLANVRVKIESVNCEYDFTAAAKWYTTDSNGRIMLNDVPLGYWQFWAEGVCYENESYPEVSCYKCFNYTTGGTKTIKLTRATTAPY